MRWWRRTLGRVGPRELVRPAVAEVVELTETIPKAGEAEVGPAGVPLPAGLRFRWRDDDGDIVEVVVLPGSGRDYRATMEGRGAVEGTASHEQLRAWYEARE